MTVTRTITLEDVTPQELAAVFCKMWAEEQAEFFDAVWQNAREWPGAGWCQQSCSIAEKLTKNGREAIETLAAHALHEQEQAA